MQGVRGIAGKPRPSWAKALIVAQLDEDESDIMTDYHGHKTTRAVALAWSRHTKDLFSEMRQAALLFAPTAHMGPGRDIWTARVVLSQDIPYEKAHTGGYFKGGRSHWHGELYPNGLDAPTFPTEAEARAYAESKGTPESIGFGGFLAAFEWAFVKRSIEHREKYSMGRGYYLKGGFCDSDGWMVEKITYQIPDTIEPLADPSEEAGQDDSNACALQEIAAVAGVDVRPNPEKGGLEIRFPEKPPTEVLASLKANGWRWSRFSSCWYTKDSEKARDFAACLAGAAVV